MTKTQVATAVKHVAARAAPCELRAAGSASPCTQIDVQTGSEDLRLAEWSLGAGGSARLRIRVRSSMGNHVPHPPSRPVLALNTRCAARDAREVSLAIMGDLHLEPAQMPLFHAARRQIRTSLRSGAGEDLADGLMPCGARVVQLGDLGGYTNAPGSRRVPSGPRRAALTISQTVSPNQDKAYPLPHVPVAHPACRSTSQTRLTAVHVVPLL